MDRIFGLFIQVFERARRQGDEEELVVDLDHWRHGLTEERMVEVAANYGFRIDLSEKIINLD